MDAHISDPKESAHRLCRLLSVNKGEREKHENDVYKHVHKSGSSRRLCVPCCTRLFALHKNYSILVFVRVAQIKWKNGNAERATKAPCIHIKGFPQDESTSADTFLSSRLEGNNKGRCWFKRQFSKTVRSLRQSKPIRFSFLRGAGHFRVSLWSKETLAASSRGRCELIERKNREMDTPSPHVGQPPKQREQGLRAVHAREPPVRQLSTARQGWKRRARTGTTAHTASQPASCAGPGHLPRGFQVDRPVTAATRESRSARRQQMLLGSARSNAWRHKKPAHVHLPPAWPARSSGKGTRTVFSLRS